MMTETNFANLVFRGGPLNHIKGYLASPKDRIAASITTKAGAKEPLSSPCSNDVISMENFKTAGGKIKQAIVDRRTLLMMIKASRLGSDIRPYLRVLERLQKNPNRRLSRSETLVLRLNQNHRASIRPAVAHLEQP